MNVEVLGGGKGGQCIDIAHTAQLMLMCGRDNQDNAACGQMDMRNFHDSMSRGEIWHCQRRRNMARWWCDAALRLQRCPEVRLAVRSGMTGVITRSRGALTGNGLAPLFGRMLVEDAFLLGQPFTDAVICSSMGVILRPMAWSDNLVAFANSSRKVAKILSLLAQQLESMTILYSQVV